MLVEHAVDQADRTIYSSKLALVTVFICIYFDFSLRFRISKTISKSKMSVRKILKSLDTLTLIREFLGPSPSAFSGKKSKIIACDVTVRTKKICADRVSVGLSCDVNFKWHMPL